MSQLPFIIIVSFVVFDFVVFGGLFLLAASSRANRPTGVGKGDLLLDTGKPNFVSSVSTHPERKIEPLRYSVADAIAWAAAVEVVSARNGIKVVRSHDFHLYAECRSPLFGFVDDLELVLHPGAGFIHVRSASRVGYSDLGANRTRVEALREAFAVALTARLGPGIEN
ncbi:MAG: DUF1499 domain-containing protein [Verrucomicrobiales bacterium]|jgi:uncharacterized protein (DUF1499 family)|nr:DUF1499 domain-containing protein [Verrucomicrobiales bacterium]HQZ27625.1 DUF1499 domain-containing protein [Verrucomicrobiales bacterium]